jgi:hypothetical protein
MHWARRTRHRRFSSRNRDHAQVNEGEQFVALYKSWENYQSIPSNRLPQPAVVAAFRRLFTDLVPCRDPQ